MLQLWRLQPCLVYDGLNKNHKREQQHLNTVLRAIRRVTIDQKTLIVKQSQEKVPEDFCEKGETEKHI
jgi:hypothetical protein